MDELIEALNLVRPYPNDYQLKYPTGADHDALFLSVDAEQLPADVLERLEELSFTVNDEYGGALTSYKFGSC